MCCDAADKWLRKLNNFSIGEEKIDSIVAFQMTAFEEDCTCKFSFEFFPGAIHRLSVFDFRSEEPLCFVEIWRDQAGEREQLLLVSFDRCPVEKPIAAGGDHDRIDYKRNLGVPYSVGHGANNLRGAKQTGLAFASDSRVADRRYRITRRRCRSLRLGKLPSLLCRGPLPQASLAVYRRRNGRRRRFA